MNYKHTLDLIDSQNDSDLLINSNLVSTCCNAPLCGKLEYINNSYFGICPVCSCQTAFGINIEQPDSIIS